MMSLTPSGERSWYPSLREAPVFILASSMSRSEGLSLSVLGRGLDTGHMLG